MKTGLVMECDYRYGATQAEAFDEAFAQAELAERLGIDSVWMAERHFAAPQQLLDAGGTGIPSLSAAPLTLASAIAARTSRLHIGTGVSVLPLCHPIRLAEETATIDHISKGRLELGVGRSSFPRSYEGYGIPYEESRGRFQEVLEILLQAWTQEKVSYTGDYYTFNDVHVLPKPYQQPHPPIRVAATTIDTFPQVGQAGYAIVTGLRGFDLTTAAVYLQSYRDAWQEAGHPGTGDVFLRMPVYVAETAERALEEPKESTIHSYRRMSSFFGSYAGAVGTRAEENRAGRAEELARIGYEELLEGRLAYGTPDMVTAKLVHLRDSLGLSGIMIEPNVGGHNTPERVQNSITLFAKEVAPQLR